MQDAQSLWADFARPIVTADDYIASLRGRNLNVFFMGERVPEPVDHPVIFPSINAMAETYRLASERPELGGVKSDIAGVLTNRFLHVPTARGRARRQARDAARAGAAHRHLLPALRRARRHRFLPFGDLRYRRRTRHRLSPALPRLPQARADRQCRHRRRHDRPEGRPLQAAAQPSRPRSVPARGQARRQRHLPSPAPRCTRPARSIRTG